MKTKNYNILLTCAGGGLSKFNSYYLKKNPNKKIKVIGVDIKKINNSNKFDKFYKVPRPESPLYLPKIKSIVKKEKISLIIPTADEEVIKFSKDKKKFEKKGVKIACETLRNVKIFTDKFKTLKFLKKNKIDNQNFFLVKSLKELKEKFIIFDEFVLKPVIGRGGRGVFIIKKKIKKTLFLNYGREINTDIDKFKKYFLQKITEFPLIITPKLQEPVYDIDFLSLKGNLKKIVMRRRVISEEPNSGHIFCKVPSYIKKKFSKICKKLYLNGLYDSDLMKDKKGIFRIIEINSRPSGSVSTTCAAGVNLLSDLIDLKINKKINLNQKIKRRTVKLY